MSHYIDGFVFPIARSSLDTYKQLAEQIAEIWKEYGALEYKEFMGDDMSLEGTRSFIDSTAATDDEVVVMGWVTFESREARDLANEKVMNDPRVEALMTSADSGFDPSRMFYGGFTTFIQ